MEFIKKMREEDKRNLKLSIIDLFDSLNKQNFITELKEVAFDKLNELSSLYSYAISVEYDKYMVMVYIDEKLSLAYEY